MSRFTEVLDIPCDLSFETLRRAADKLRYEGVVPTVLRVSRVDVTEYWNITRRVLATLGAEGVEIRVMPDFKDDAWCLGTEEDYGWGSEGA
jgi:hypothetical protein